MLIDIYRTMEITSRTIDYSLNDNTTIKRGLFEWNNCG